MAQRSIIVSSTLTSRPRAARERTKELVDEPRALLRSRNRAAVVLSEDAIPDSREGVVRHVSERAGHDRDDARQVPDAAEVACYTKRALGADVDPLISGTVGFDEYQRVDASDFRMP